MRWINIVAVILMVLSIPMNYINKEFIWMSINSFLLGVNLAIVINNILNEE